jgi:hypothetical protein
VLARHVAIRSRASVRMANVRAPATLTRDPGAGSASTMGRAAP